MEIKKLSKQIVALLCLSIFLLPTMDAQTKKLKRPKSRVGITSVDNFVQESFDLYDKVYKYDGYAESGTPLEDEDLDVLEDALDDVTNLSDSAPDILSDLDGVSVLKQGKATLQMNRAKKALKYSITTAKKLLTENRNEKTDDESNEGTSNSETEDDSSNNPNDNNGSNGSNEASKSSSKKNELKINSKFDFVPGDKLLFYDDFLNDFLGDFPANWNTNGSGELVTINDSSDKWLKLVPGYRTTYIPDITDLPEEYTLEFDVLSKGLTPKTSSQAYLKVIISNNNTFERQDNFAMVEIPFCQFVKIPITVENSFNNKRQIRNDIDVDIRSLVLEKMHISIAVNKQRFRLWINQNKYVDVPRLLPKDLQMKGIKLNLKGIDINKEGIFVSNFKIAKGGVDLRRKLLSEGKISTNGILFDSGSANIQPQSYGIIRQISQVLQQDNSIRLNIIGHTDADGDEKANKKLSEARAAAVKVALVDIYKISADRLATEGKGESEPVGDNATADGKAQNRRVEFVKM